MAWCATSAKLDVRGRQPIATLDAPSAFWSGSICKRLAERLWDAIGLELRLCFITRFVQPRVFASQ